MRYQGGKTRQAKRIVSHFPAGDVYIEPFLGGASVAALATSMYGSVFLSDANEDLMVMWEGAIAGTWVPPTVPVTEEGYAVLKAGGGCAPDRAFAATALSFGGKWFGGFARPGVSGRDYQGEGVRAVLRKAEGMRGASVMHRDYGDCVVPDDATGYVLYADPPYADTTGYDAVSGGFDSVKMWEYMGLWAEAGASVFVSEYSAPAGWRVVDAWERQSFCNPGKGVAVPSRSVECLYTYDRGEGC